MRSSWQDIQKVMQYYGVDQTTAERALALAPASALLPKAVIGTSTSDGGIEIPWWLFSGLLGFFFGVILGPSVFATTEAGSRKLAELARRKIGA